METQNVNCCRNCGRAKVNSPRGLCWSCYYRDGVRDRFPSTSKYARKGADGSSLAPLPSPTNAAPGTEEKVKVLEARMQRREALWHPHDAKEHA